MLLRFMVLQTLSPDTDFLTIPGYQLLLTDITTTFFSASRGCQLMQLLTKTNCFTAFIYSNVLLGSGADSVKIEILVDKYFQWFKE